MIEPMDALGYKEEGNKAYKAGNFAEAITAYTKAIEITPKKTNEKAVFLKNRSACHLKLENYEKAANDASSAIDITPGDTKALFRLCQALEQMGKSEQAFQEARKLIHLEPKNTAVQQMLMRLTVCVSEKAKKFQTTDNKVEQMFKALEESGIDEEKKIQAANNLIVLSREEAGAQKIFAENGVERIKKLLTTEDTDLQTAGLRILSCLCSKHKSRAWAVLKQLSLETLAVSFSSKSEAVCNSAASVLLSAVNSLIGENVGEVKGGDMAVVPDPTPEFKSLMMFFMGLLTNESVSGFGRDAVIDMIIKFVPKKEGIGRALTFVTNGGLLKLLDVAGQIPDEPRYPITTNTRMHCSVALDKLYNEMTGDKTRGFYEELCFKFVANKFSANSLETNMEALIALSALLQGPYDVGNKMLSKEGVMEVMVAMASSKVTLHQKVALETIIHAANKKDKCTGVLQSGVEIIKKLYKSSNDHIKIRALVGLCKLGSYGGTDYGLQAFSEGSTLKLSKEVQRFLVNAQKDHDLKKWAAEGLAFLSLDADVKEDVVGNTEALHALMDLAKTVDHSALYGVISTFVNLTNSYDVEEIDPTMKKLAEYAKQHVPEEHPKDSKEHVRGRVEKLVKADIITALVALSKTESENSRELLSRVYLAIAEDEKHRGNLVQKGGAKCLIPLANEGTEVGKTRAAQALAKIAITMNPELAFPGERALEVVRPLISLLHIDNTGLQNFEALLALTNLSSLRDSIRGKIMTEKNGFSSIENYMFEDHDMIKRAATECMCNLASNKLALERFKGENDRVKLLVLFCFEEDTKLVAAASGCLACLTRDEEICSKIFKVKQGLEALQVLCVSQDVNLQLRGVAIVSNIIDSNKENASKLMETELLEILMALSKLKEPGQMAVQERAAYSLERAAELGLIQHVGNGQAS
ncbi:protein unc-45 homolog B-like isoform X2 [Apostichopus japonicus]|uniref:protein unc-45 homolog B-like isoform X2 n=1 Tax=Stichopus japonicus TaxID=307972 RepID=UPI003AB33AF2